MLAFLKSDLFLRFLCGFALGTVGVLALQPDEQPALTQSAYAAPIVDRAAN
jgi:hypothetical protein